MEFTAIDFETANGSRNSACALGVVRVENGRITEEKSWLIHPPEMYFHPFNVQIHGIRPEDVMEEPVFGEIWDELQPYLQDQIVVAHNASFDISVLRACMDTFGIAYPDFNYLCTVQLSRQVWPLLENHKLDTLANYFNIPLIHHDALEDTRACAKIAVKACHERHSANLEDLSYQLKIRPGKVFHKGYTAPKRFK